MPYFLTSTLLFLLGLGVIVWVHSQYHMGIAVTRVTSRRTSAVVEGLFAIVVDRIKTDQNESKTRLLEEAWFLRTAIPKAGLHPRRGQSPRGR